MKSTVCKKANELIRKGYTRSQAFKKAWVIAKSIKASDIKEGNVIRMEYGDYGNKIECTITSKSDELFLGELYIINAVSKTGMNMEFCAEPEKLFEKVA